MMEAVISELMTLARDAPDELGPPIGVTAEDEEGRLRLRRLQRIENDRRRDGIGSIVEGERDPGAIAGQSRECATEKWAVAVEGAVGGARGDRRADRGRGDHAASTATLRTRS